MSDSKEEDLCKFDNLQDVQDLEEEIDLSEIDRTQNPGKSEGTPSPGGSKERSLGSLRQGTPDFSGNGTSSTKKRRMIASPLRRRSFDKTREPDMTVDTALNVGDSVESSGWKIGGARHEQKAVEPEISASPDGDALRVLNDANAKVARYDAQLNLLMADNVNFAQSNLALEQKCKDLEKSRADAVKKILEYARDLEDYKKLHPPYSDLECKNRRLEEERSTLFGKLAAAGTIMRQAELDAENSAQQIAKLQKNLQTSKEDSDDTIGALRSQLSSKNEENEDLLAQIQQMTVGGEGGIFDAVSRLRDLEVEGHWDLTAIDQKEWLFAQSKRVDEIHAEQSKAVKEDFGETHVDMLNLDAQGQSLAQEFGGQASYDSLKPGSEQGRLYAGSIGSSRYTESPVMSSAAPKRLAENSPSVIGTFNPRSDDLGFTDSNLSMSLLESPSKPSARPSLDVLRFVMTPVESPVEMTPESHKGVSFDNLPEQMNRNTDRQRDFMRESTHNRLELASPDGGPASASELDGFTQDETPAPSRRGSQQDDRSTGCEVEWTEAPNQDPYNKLGADSLEGSFPSDGSPQSSEQADELDHRALSTIERRLGFARRHQAANEEAKRKKAQRDHIEGVLDAVLKKNAIDQETAKTVLLQLMSQIRLDDEDFQPPEARPGRTDEDDDSSGRTVKPLKPFVKPLAQALTSKPSWRNSLISTIARGWKLRSPAKSVDDKSPTTSELAQDWPLPLSFKKSQIDRKPLTVDVGEASQEALEKAWKGFFSPMSTGRSILPVTASLGDPSASDNVSQVISSVRAPSSLPAAAHLIPSPAHTLAPETASIPSSPVAVKLSDTEGPFKSLDLGQFKDEKRIQVGSSDDPGSHIRPRTIESMDKATNPPSPKMITAPETKLLTEGEKMRTQEMVDVSTGGKGRSLEERFFGLQQGIFHFFSSTSSPRDSSTRRTTKSHAWQRTLPSSGLPGFPRLPVLPIPCGLPDTSSCSRLPTISHPMSMLGFPSPSNPFSRLPGFLTSFTVAFKSADFVLLFVLICVSTLVGLCCYILHESSRWYDVNERTYSHVRGHGDEMYGVDWGHSLGSWIVSRQLLAGSTKGFS